MSLSAVRTIIDVSDPLHAGIVASFSSSNPAKRGFEIRNDIADREFYFVRPSADPTRFWDSVAIDDPSQLRFAIGDKDSPPDAGLWKLIFMSDFTGLDELSFDISAAVLQTALNANAAVDAAGGVTVQKLSSGNYAITFVLAGAQELFGSDALTLDPECNVFVSYLREGTVDLPCIQLIELVQRPYVYNSSWTALPSTATATVTQLRAGSGSVKALYTLSIAPVPYAGPFTVTSSIGASSPVSPSVSDLDFSAALNFGDDGGWTVMKTGEGSWTMECTIVGDNTIDSADVSALLVYGGVTGRLQFNSGALYRRFLTEEGDNFSSTVQMRLDGTGTRETLLYVGTQLYRDVLSVAGLSPSGWPGGFLSESAANDGYVINFSAITALTGGGAGALDGQNLDGVTLGRIYRVVIAGVAYDYKTEASSDATSEPDCIRAADWATSGAVYRLLGLRATTVRANSFAIGGATLLGNVGGSAPSPSAAGNTTVTGSLYQAMFHEVTVGAGAGTYTHVIVLAATSQAAYGVKKFTISLPAAAGRVIEFRNSTSGGTLLDTFTSLDTATTAFFEAYFNGSAWKLSGSNILIP